MTQADLERLSLNQATTQSWSVEEAIHGSLRAGLHWIGLWRDKIAEYGLERTTRLVRDTGIGVSSLCRGGMFPAATKLERRRRIDDNMRAVDEAAVLGARTLVLVCGGMHGKDLEGARDMVAHGLQEIVPYARSAKVSLGIEPLHPMFCADRNVIVTLNQAVTLANEVEDRLDAGGTVGVIVDAYHVWWDPHVIAGIEHARGAILGFHVSDWITPLPDPLLGRGMMGDGWIDLRRLRRAVDASGFTGPIEVEIFNRALWALPGHVLLEQIKERFAAEVLDG